jgi:hypothetical protein
MSQLLIPRLPVDALAVLGAMSAAGAPGFGLQFAALVFASGLVTGRPEIDGVEYFAGQGAVTTALQTDGLLVYAYERDTDALLHDIMSDVGFAHALALLLRVRRGGVVWFPKNYLRLSPHASNLFQQMHLSCIARRLRRVSR